MSRRRPPNFVRVACTLLGLAFALPGCGNSSSGSASDAGNTPADTTAPTFAGAKAATGLGESQANIAWDAASDDVTPPAQIAYRVYESDDTTFDYSHPVLVTPAGATNAVVSGLTAGKEHGFVVRAVDAAGNEDANTVTVKATTTDDTPPSFGGVQSVTAPGTTTLHVEWDPAADNATPASDIVYEIFVSTTQGDYDYTTPAATTAAGATSADVTVAQDATTYFVVVRAVDASGHADQNQKELSTTTLDGTAPTFAGATGASVRGTTITLSWTAATDNVTPTTDIAYRVYMKTGSGTYDFSTPSATTAPGATSQAIIGLDVSTQYDFIVRAVDGAGNEDTNSVEKSATTAASADVTPPTFGGLVTATGRNATSVRLTWAAASDDTSATNAIVYDVFVAASSGAQNFSTPSYTTTAGAVAFNVTGLTPLQQLYVVVRARDQAGNEDANDNELAVASLADTTPPTFGGVTGVTSPSPSSIDVSWTAATDDSSAASAIRYRIYVATTSGAQNFTTPTATSAAGQTSLAVNGLAPNKQYWVVVRAVDAYGNEDANTTQISVTTQKDITAPTFAGATSATTLSKTSISVSWSAASDDTTAAAQIVYLVCISKNATTCTSAFTANATTAAGASSYTAANLTPGTPYYFVVRARDTTGNVDTNIVQRTATTTADTAPPTFGGATGVAGATTSSLTVTWNAATDDTTAAASIKYSICISTTPGTCTGAGFTVNAQVTGVTSRQYTGLTVNTQYCFVVRAEDISGNRDTNSVERCGVTNADTTPPTFGGATTATQNGDTSINVSWNTATDDISASGQIVYDLCWTTTNGGCSGGSFVTDASSAAGATSFSAASLTPSTTYYFVVRARDQAGNRDTNSTQVSTATAADTTAPSTPVSPYVDNPTLTSLRVNWSAATDDATSQPNLRYRVCVVETANCSTTGTGALTFTAGGLVQNTLYHFQIYALDQAGNPSAAPATVQGTTLADTTPPTWSSGPTLSVNYATPTQLGVSWSLATDNYYSASGICYDVCASSVSSNCTGSNFDANRFNAGCGVTGTTLTGLLTRTSYYVAVRARDGSGNTETFTHAAIASTPTSYAIDVLPKVFQTSYASGGCMGGCHATTTGDWTRADVVNVFSTSGYTDTVGCGGQLYRVQPGVPQQSYLYRKMLTFGNTAAPFSASCPDNYSGGQMPCAGALPSATQQSIILDWITQGALNN